MELITMITTIIANTITIASISHNFIKSLGMKSTPELEQKVTNVLEMVKLDQTTEESILEGLTNIPQLEHFDKDHLKKQFENIYNECTNSNVANYNNSNGNITLQIHGNGQINISDLESLQQVPNNDKKQVEDSLFESVKKLMIEFLELIENNEKQEQLCEEYKIHLSTRSHGYDMINNHLTEYNSTALYLACVNIIQTTYKLTDIQLKRIISIIDQIKPSIIRNIHLTSFSENKLLFCLPNENPMTIERDQLEFANIEIVPQRLEEIKKGDWDNLIKSSIKELG